jgi:hypothetical protein
VKFRIEVIRCVSDRWPADFRLPSIVVSCLPGQDVDSASPVDLRISKDWLQSTTGGVFVEVCILDKPANYSANNIGRIRPMQDFAPRAGTRTHVDRLDCGGRTQSAGRAGHCAV